MQLITAIQLAESWLSSNTYPQEQHQNDLREAIATLKEATWNEIQAITDYHPSDLIVDSQHILNISYQLYPEQPSADSSRPKPQQYNIWCLTGSSSEIVETVEFDSQEAADEYASNMDFEQSEYWAEPIN